MPQHARLGDPRTRRHTLPLDDAVRAAQRRGRRAARATRAGVRGQGHSNPLATFAKGKPAYIAYVGGVSVAGGGEHLQLGYRSKVTISLGDVEVTRTVKLQANTKESAVERQLGF